MNTDLSEKGFRGYLRNIAFISNMFDLDKCVYSLNPVEYKRVVANQKLTEEHCRYLLPLLPEALYRALLVEQETFPKDLLDSLALTEPDPLVRRVIAFHPNSSEETKSIVALRGTITFDGYFSKIRVN